MIPSAAAVAMLAVMAGEDPASSADRPPPNPDHLFPEPEPVTVDWAPQMRAAAGIDKVRRVEMVLSATWNPTRVVCIVPADEMVASKQPHVYATTQQHHEFKVEHAPIDTETAEALAALWEVALAGVQESPHVFVVDTPRWMFATGTNRENQRRGWTDGTSPGSRIRELVDVGGLLFAYASAPPSEREARSRDLRKKADAARARLIADVRQDSVDGSRR